MSLRRHIGFACLVTAASLAPRGSLRAAAAVESNLENGRHLFATCQACHDAPAEAPNRGPTLAGVVGRKPGAVRGFPYSRALKNAKHAWDEATLSAFLANPQAFAPGTTMPFAGLPDETKRRDLIAFLQTLR